MATRLLPGTWYILLRDMVGILEFNDSSKHVEYRCIFREKIEQLETCLVYLHFMNSTLLVTAHPQRGGKAAVAMQKEEFSEPLC